MIKRSVARHVIFALAVSTAVPHLLADEPAVNQSTAATVDDLSSLSLEDLMNVEVTSVSKKKESIAKAPAAITVISQDDIRRSGFSTIPDLLRLVPGMSVARVSSNVWAVNARGLNNTFAPNLLVLQDGRSVYEPLYGGTYWDTIDYVTEDLSRIEVIRGPGATLWGANAVNGVINITSKEAQETQGWLLSSRASNDDSFQSIRYGGQLSENTFYRAYLKAKYNDEFVTAADEDAGDNWHSLRGGFRVDSNSSDRDKLTIQGDLGQNRTNQLTNIVTTTSPFSQSFVADGEKDIGNLLARWTHRVDDTQDFSLQFYVDYLSDKDRSIDFDRRSWDLDFHHRFQLNDRNEISWGLGYRLVSTNVDATDQIAFDPSTSADNLISAFIQDTITVVPDKWFFTLGSKFEHNDYTGFEIQPSARLLWTPTHRDSVWASVSRAVRTPTRVDDGIRLVQQRFNQQVAPGVVLPAEIVLTGSRDLQAEELIAYELGYRSQLSKEVSVDIALFYNNYAKMRSAVVGAPGAGVPIVIPVTLANQIAGDIFGGELSTTAQVTDKWQLSGSVSVLHANFWNLSGSTDTTTVAGAENSSPEVQAQIHSHLELAKNLEFNAGVYYVGHVTNLAPSAAPQTPAYISTNINLVWRPREAMQVSVGINNLFDDRHPEFISAGGISDEVPRTAYVQFSYAF